MIGKTAYNIQPDPESRCVHPIGSGNFRSSFPYRKQQSVCMWQRPFCTCSHPVSLQSKKPHSCSGGKDPRQVFLNDVRCCSHSLYARALEHTLTSPPSWVFERIDIGCPKVKSSTTMIVESSCLGGDDARNIVNELVIKCSAHENWLWERGSRAVVTISLPIFMAYISDSSDT